MASINPRYQKRQLVERGEIPTDRRTPIPEKIANAGGNTYTTTALGKAIGKQIKFPELTRLTAVPRTGLVETAYKQLIMGSRHLISLGSPFLKSLNSLA